MQIQCCGISHKVDIFRIKPNSNDILEEVALVFKNKQGKYLTVCCKKPVVEIRRLIYAEDNCVFTGEVIEAEHVRLVGEKAQEYINTIALNTIFKQKTLNVITQIENRWYLNCNKFGKIEKCYSNLSTCRDGFLPDQMEDLRQQNKIF